jgi:hypothetical protein
MAVEVLNSFYAHDYENHLKPFGAMLWKATVTIPEDATTVSVQPDNPIDGVVCGVWIDPTTLTVGATIKGYMVDDGLSTPDYFLNYTVPDPAAETRAALAKRMRVHGVLQVDVASATAGDSFVLYVFVDPNADTDGGEIEITNAASSLGPNSTQADQRLTVDATVGGVKLAALHADTTTVYVTVEDAQVRVTFDDSAPTSTNGHILNPYYAGFWSAARAAAAKFIRTGSTSGVVHCSQLKGA